MNHKQQLQQGLQVLGLSLNTAQQLLLLEYVALLKKWNSTYNLTALRDEATMISHHVLDSLTLLPYIENAQTLMDVGSGGGMPGIPPPFAAPICRLRFWIPTPKKPRFCSRP